MKTYNREDIDFSDYDEVRGLYSDFEDSCEKQGWVGFLGIHSKSELESCYLLEKPVTMLEVVAPHEQVEDLADRFDEYFYTCIVQESEVESEEGDYHQLYISRFKSLIDVTEDFLNNTTDSRADLAGILFGYRPSDVAGYCQEQSNKLFK